MKKPYSFIHLTFPFLFLFLLAVSSCEKAYDFEDDTKKETETDKDSNKDTDKNTDTDTSTSTQLVVKVKMSANDTITEEEIYPISVYVMDSDEDCCGFQKIRSANQDLEFTLKSGVYNVYAVGGAANYDLPTQSEAKGTTLIKLLKGKSHGDLRMAFGQVSLSEEKTATQTLQLTRRTLQVQSIKFENIPSDVTAVKLRIQPLYKTIALNGNFEEGSTSHSFTLHKQSDGHTWVSENSEYLFESPSDETTLKVMLIRSDSTTTYTYTCQEKLEASHRVNILVSLQNDGSMQFNGTVQSTKWSGAETDAFNFDDSNNTRTVTESNEDFTGELYGNAPERGTLYKGCFVLRTQNVKDTTVVTLITPEEENKVKISQSKDASKVAQSIKTNTNSALDNLRVTGITGWRLPTLEEMQYVDKHLDKINEFIKLINTPTKVFTPIERNYSNYTTTYNCGYFFNADDGYIYVYEFDTGIVKKPSSERATYKVRGFTTLRFTD